jgi:hypothetical protein
MNMKTAAKYHIYNLSLNFPVVGGAKTYMGSMENKRSYVPAERNFRVRLSLSSLVIAEFQLVSHSA